MAAAVVVGAVFLALSGLQRHAEGPWRAIELLGIAYYTCRLIHLLFDGIGGARQASPRELLRYQFFWPVLVTGPIHRFEHFRRECRRRRADPADIHLGIERMLFGYAKVVLIATVFLGGTLGEAIEAAAFAPWLDTWSSSVVDWAALYFLFAGWTDIALGASLAIGLRLEENFDRPWAATTLIDFWRRWHITLSAWCRDYVFAPVLAATRRAAAALFCAMLAMGLWHEVSFYYVAWAAWHALGIGGCRLFQRWRERTFPERVPAPASSARGLAWSTATRAMTLGWITVAPLAIGALGIVKEVPLP